MLEVLAWLLGLLMTSDESTPLRYLALGDSYTIGESVDADERWPAQLVERLAQRGIVVAPPRYVATTGWTTDELSAAMDRAGLAPCWDLVSLSIGVNNQYRGRPVAEFEKEYGVLLERAIGLAGDDADRVFVLSIPDWAVTPFAVGTQRDLDQMSREIDAYNTAKREVTRARGVLYFDITPSTREVPEEPALVAGDGLHPSGALYTRWVAQIEAAIASRVGSLGPCKQ